MQKSYFPQSRSRRKHPKFFSLFFCLPGVLLLCAVFAAQQLNNSENRINGIVSDQTGAAVVNAKVSFYEKSVLIAQTATDKDGHFSFEAGAADEVMIVVEAPGFSAARQTWNSGKAGKELEFTLEPAMLSEKVVVSATRTETRLGQTAASVSVISANDLSATAAVTIDDSIRQIPGFQLFRRTGSRTANPTAQGISLRGVGASGASRAVVLKDGIPLNDPFGGWVYWSRVPRESIESLEVLRGGASSLYGSGALGGAVNILTRDAEKPTLAFSTSYGSQNTAEASLFTAGSLQKWGASLAAEWFSTDGFIAVEKQSRGIVDTPADSRHTSFDFKLNRKIGSFGKAFAGISVFGEARGNGTPLQTNRTHLRQFSGGTDLTSEKFGALSVRLYGGSQVYDQVFTSVAANRDSETLLRLQRVPAQFFGFSGQWTRVFGKTQTVIMGIESSAVRGTSDETAFFQNVASSNVSAGGRERVFALFGEDVLRLSPKLFVTAKIRFDRWRNFAGKSETRPIRQPAQVTVNSFPDRSETALSPQISVLYQRTENFSLFASAYQSFRAPTLNELYRSFRVGDVLTLANENLRAERLNGVEAGANFSFAHPRIEVRSVLFWSEVARPVANLTLSVSPSLITRQRQNLGRTRSRGLEIDFDFRPHRNWMITGGYLFADSIVTDFPANPVLVGRLIPQVARHQFTFQARYTNPSILSFGLQGRYGSKQFDDDQNLLPLKAYFTLDALVSRRINRNFEVFLAAENLLNQRYPVGRTPITTIGSPVTLRGGFRLHFGSR